MLLAYLKRMALLAGTGRRCPVWVVEKELFPLLPFAVERWFLSRATRVLVDYDDAVFLKYDRPKGRRERSIVNNKIARLMSMADVVLCGNPYLEAYARQAGAKDVRALPKVVDESRYLRPRPARTERRTVIGWIGSHRNSHHLLSIGEVLRHMCQEENCVVRIVGGARIPLPDGVAVEYREWSEEREVDELGGFDIGIMLLEDGAWERGKCGLKLIQYLAAGVPVVASPVGMNSRIVVPGVNGYLADRRRRGSRR